MLGATMATRWGRRVSKSVQELHADAAAGRLPQVAFVDTNYLNVGDPEKGETEHPPEHLQRGQKFVYDLVVSLTRSPQWKSLALFITYDEHGGLYDHVVPPPACVPDASPVTGEPGQTVTGAFDRLGFRVPLLVVSPFAKRGFVSHQTYDHTSILRFIQAKHRVPALTARDANARIPTDFFDFTRPPDLSVPAFTEPAIDPVESEYCRLTFKR
jgi:phospholipase C